MFKFFKYKSYQKNILTLKGQIQQRYENYLESAVRNREFLNVRFQGVASKKIVPMRQYGEQEEEVLFESEFSDLIKDEGKQKELLAANKEAIRKNVARKKKSPACQCKSCQA